MSAPPADMFAFVPTRIVRRVFILSTVNNPPRLLSDLRGQTRRSDG